MELEYITIELPDKIDVRRLAIPGEPCQMEDLNGGAVCMWKARNTQAYPQQLLKGARSIHLEAQRSVENLIPGH